jgi:GNAT superfamily N-acetyltransferase
MATRKPTNSTYGAAAPRPRNLLTDLTDEKLAAAVELNAAERLRLEGGLPWVEFHDDGDAIRAFAGDTWPANRIALARFAPATASRRVGEILERHLQAKVACNWIVGPVSQPPDLGKHLRAHGFKCMIHCAGMGCDLTHLPPPPPMPKGVTIGLKDEPPSLEPLTTERRRHRHEGRKAMIAITPRQAWYFSATVDGKPVGETMLLAGEGVAGIYEVEVQRKFRRRGIGAALVHAALTFAREHLGYRAAVLAATGMGSRVYGRVGFREVGMLSFWKYGKMRQQPTLTNVLRNAAVSFWIARNK